MTAKNVKCADCKFCDNDKSWCRVKALGVTVGSVRNCKIFTKADDKGRKK